MLNGLRRINFCSKAYPLTFPEVTKIFTCAPNMLISLITSNNMHQSMECWCEFFLSTKMIHLKLLTNFLMLFLLIQALPRKHYLMYIAEIYFSWYPKSLLSFWPVLPFNTPWKRWWTLWFQETFWFSNDLTGH